MAGFSGHTLPGKVGKNSTEKVEKRPALEGGRGPNIVQVLEAEIGFKKLPSVADLMRILMRDSKWPAPADGAPGPKIVQVSEADFGFKNPSNCTRPVEPKSAQR